MRGTHPILCVIPSRGGSKGLPGKNIRQFAGMPLLAHSLLCARMCPAIDSCIVSTDSKEIAVVARSWGADVPFMRLSELASDGAPMLGVLQHAVRFMEERDSRRYEAILLLDPTSPSRLPADIDSAVNRLEADEYADRIVSVSKPEFSPYWHCVVPRGDYMEPLMPGAVGVVCRQELPPVFRINGSVYLWRRDFLLSVQGSSWLTGRILMLETPEATAVAIDDLPGFERAEILVRAGFIQFPWLDSE